MSHPTRTPTTSLAALREGGPRRPRPSLLSLAAPLALLVVSQAPVQAEAAPWDRALAAAPVEAARGEQPNRIDGLTVEELDDGTTVLRVQGSRKPTFNVYRLSGPERLVVDIAGSEPGKVVPHVPLDTWACGRVTVDGVQERDTNLVRLVVTLKREASYIVLPKGGELVVTVTPREMAPEAYFAHKSADERRAEIERNVRDVEALQAEARVLHSHAREQAAEVDRKVSEATDTAEAARQAERRAKEAEVRAAAAEAQARQTLADAKNGKLRLRRALKQAEEARTLAEGDRKLAHSQRTRAEAALARARTELEAERKQLAHARGQTESERKQLEQARGQTEAERKQLAQARGQTEAERKQLARERGRVQQTEAAAKAELARAQHKSTQAGVEAAKVLEAARGELASAEAAAQKARSKTQAALIKAEKDAARAARAVDEADAAAKRKLEETAAEAAKQLAQARANADAAAAAAKRKLTQAETALAQAEKAAAQKLRAAERAEAEAKALLAEARAQAERETTTTLAAAHKAEAEAKALLADARAQAEREATTKLAAAHQVEAEVQRRAKAQVEAEQQAVQKLRAAEEAESEAKRKAEGIVARAEAQAAADIAAAAAAAKRKAEQRLAKAEAEAEAHLAQAKAKAEQQTVREAERALAKLRQQSEAEVARQVAAAKTKAQAQAQADLRKARERAAALEAEAEAKLAAAESTLASAEADAARKQQQAKTALTKAERALIEAETERKAAVTARKWAEQRLATTEAKVREAERQGELTKELQKSLTAAKRAKAEAEQRVATAQGEIGRLEGDRDALERTLATLRAQSEALEGKIAASTQELASLERKVADARKHAEATVPLDPPSPSKTRKKAAPDEAPTAFIRDVRFEDGDDESRVIIELDGPVRFEGKSLTPDIQLLALEGARIDPRLERSLDASAYAGPVERVTSFAEHGGAKVIVATNGPTKPRLEQTNGTLVWHFPRGPAHARAAAEDRRPPRAPAHEVASLPGSRVGGFATKAAPAAAMLAPAPPSGSRSIGPSEPVDQAPARGGTRWRGERIDIELQDAPIKDVLLLFSDIGRVNIIAGRNVEGSVTMKLTAVPWDQALDIILRSLTLGMVREGNVIRVATSEDLENERRQAIEQANARVQLKPLETRLVPISYATVDEMVPKVQSVLSPRGTVTPDTRTNTLIIMDVAENIALAEQLVSSLDTQTPQVLIEARIVEARTSFQRTLGIQWGFDFTASPGTGNPTGLLFPNSLGLAGGATGTPADRRGLVLPGAAANPNYVVDLPAPVGTGSGGALGFSFGSISGNLNTNLRLSQLEETGEVRIISAPKIITLDNSEAQIEQGVQIPISQVSAQGVNTRFVNATLSLRVTPHVTNEGAVLLDVQVQKNEADFVNTGARGDPTILTKQARSRMLVNDNDTAVIGGIYTRNKAVNFSKVPWLADIPIIGWFFKNKNEADTRSEVLIFLTPKIVNRASSIGG